MSAQDADTIYHAGLLHDIGKIAMHDERLANLGNLAPSEFETVKQHPLIDVRTVGPLSFLSDVADKWILLLVEKDPNFSQQAGRHSFL